MRRRKIILVVSVIGILFLFQGIPVVRGGVGQEEIKSEEQRVLEWRKERDDFSKSHQRSPLNSKEKKHFKGLKYYPFNS